MTRKEIEILLAMAENQGWASVDEIADEDWPSFRTLAERRFIVREGALNMAGYRLTEAGRVALEEVNDAAEKQAHRDADARRQKLADDQKAVVDKKQQFRHDFKVAGFSVVLTLLLDHLVDLVDLVKVVLEAFR